MSTVLANTITAVGGGGSTVKVNNDSTYISDGGAVTDSNLVQGLAKHWSHLDGSQSAASMAQDSFNLSSMTDSGTGTYVFTLSNIMANVSHSSVATGSHMSDGHIFLSISVYTTSGAKFICTNGTGGSAVDSGDLSVQTAGDLALSLIHI